MGEDTRRSNVTPSSWEVGRATSVTIDDFAPEWDYGAIEHVVADAEPSVAYLAVRHLDLMAICSRLAGRLCGCGVCRSGSSDAFLRVFPRA